MKNKHWAAAGGDRRRTDDTLYSGWVWEWRFYIRLHFMSSVGVLSPRQGDREGWKLDSCAEQLQLRNSSVWIINSIKDFWINDESDKERSLQPRHAVASVYSEISVWLSVWRLWGIWSMDWLVQVVSMCQLDSAGHRWERPRQSGSLLGLTERITEVMVSGQQVL